MIDNASVSLLATPDDPTPAFLTLDQSQRAAATHSGPLARVLGAPGTGKTTVVIEHVVNACLAQGIEPGQCLVLAPSRVAAASLRGRITAALGGTTVEPLARTPESLAFAVVGAHAQLEQGPAPHLITGAEQDVILSELLAGHRAGTAQGPKWPEHLRQAEGTRAFRHQLRELLMRAAEHGLDPQQLRELGATRQMPVWRAAADVLQEYEDVVSLAHPGAHDPAGLLTTAADLLTAHEHVRRRICDNLRLLVVDDAQELSVARSRLVAALHDAGVPLLLVGDPDVGTQAFRGGDLDFLARGWSRPTTGRGRGRDRCQLPGVSPAEAPTYVLTRSYRAGTQLLDVTQRVRAHVGASTGPAHRRCEPATQVPSGSLETAVLESGAHEARHIATTLRRAHLLAGLPWDRMAIIARGGERCATLRRALLAEGIPVCVPGAKVPLSAEPAIRPLLALLSACLPEAMPLTSDEVADLLTSRVIGADPLAVRRMRRELRRAELESGGSRSSDALLAVAVQQTRGEPQGDTVATPAEGPRLLGHVQAGRGAASLARLVRV
ncbi:MAG: ATP-dependent helicase, partial [Micrococcales bacterium]|nr:ATP-dependent helicase [Micrococcales bacterium]